MFAPNKVSEYFVKVAFYAQLQIDVDSSHTKNILNILGDFNEIIGTDRVGWGH